MLQSPMLTSVLPECLFLCSFWAFSWASLTGFFLQAIHNRELAVGFVATVFWLCLYLFERSWVKMLGSSGTLMIYAGLATVMVDRYLMRLSALASRRTVRVPRVTGTPQAFSRV